MHYAKGLSKFSAHLKSGEFWHVITQQLSFVIVCRLKDIKNSNSKLTNKLSKPKTAPFLLRRITIFPHWVVFYF